MAPSNLPFYQKDEKVLCFHHELLYEAKVLDYKHIDENDKKSPYQYRVHYKGWKNTWDDWVPQDRIRKNSEENKELAANLKSEMDKTLKPAKAAAPSTKKRAAGSDLSSTRGSEERQTPAMGRGQKRGRDSEIEKVGETISSSHSASPPPAKRTRTPSSKASEGKDKSVNGKGTNLSVQKVANPAPKKVVRPNSTVSPVKNVTNAPMEKAGKPKSARSGSEERRYVVAGIPLQNTPKDLERFVKQRRAQMNAARPEHKKLKGTSLEPIANKKKPTKQEEAFNQRPAIHIPVPDNLKSLLVDDWEYVTKNLSLIPLPAEQPVNVIIDAYGEEEKTKRRIGSAEYDILQEVVAGMKEYFEKTLGKILLYRFERQQYLEVHKKMNANQGEWKDKAIGDIYGAEHLARLMVSLPELIAQTNMDEQSVRKLRDEMVKMTAWLAKNASRFFIAEYEPQSQDYIDKARGG